VAVTSHETQYFEMLGSRSIVHRLWKATTDHVSTGVLDEEERLTGSRSLADDHWALFDLSRDFSESTDVSAAHPGVVRDLAHRWQDEAERNHVLPLYDGLMSRLGALMGPLWPPGDDVTYHPGAGPVGDESLPLLFGGFRFTAEAEATEDPVGVLFALGDWNGGFALFVAGGRLTFAYSRAGELLEVVADRPVPPGIQALGVVYLVNEAANGTFHLLHGDTPVGRLDVTGMLPPAPQHGGAGLRLGHDAGLPVSSRYRVPARWNGRLSRVRLQTPGAGPDDPLRALWAALHAD
jgi:arylsulfatase